MSYKELINTYGRYISFHNQKLLSRSWNSLSEKAQGAFVFQLEQTQIKEIQFLSKAFT